MVVKIKKIVVLSHVMAEEKKRLPGVLFARQTANTKLTLSNLHMENVIKSQIPF